MHDNAVESEERQDIEEIMGTVEFILVAAAFIVAALGGLVYMVFHNL